MKEEEKKNALHTTSDTAQMQTPTTIKKQKQKWHFSLDVLCYTFKLWMSINKRSKIIMKSYVFLQWPQGIRDLEEVYRAYMT